MKPHSALLTIWADQSYWLGLYCVHTSYGGDYIGSEVPHWKIK